MHTEKSNNLFFVLQLVKMLICLIKEYHTKSNLVLMTAGFLLLSDIVFKREAFRVDSSNIIALEESFILRNYHNNKCNALDYLFVYVFYL
jgi:hypothetical protein